jgi:hypothetical protein
MRYYELDSFGSSGGEHGNKPSGCKNAAIFGAVEEL